MLQLGPFQIHEQLSRRLGVEAYWATDTRTQQTVVLYVLDLHAQQASALAPGFRQAVQRTSQLRHAHVVAFQQSGEHDHYLYLATAPLAGSTLAASLQQRKGSLTAHETTTLIQQVASGLEAAHAQQILHLALTPDEIWIDENGQAHVLGLGLPNAEDLGAGVQATRGGPGISPYTAPEQVRGDAQIDHRADVYSLGAIAYTLLLDQPPLPASDPLLLATDIVQRPPTPPEHLKPDLPDGVIQVFRFVLAKDPKLRYAGAGELATALAQALRWQDIPAEASAAVTPRHVRRASSRWLAGVLLALLFVLLVGVLLVWRPFQQALSERTTMNSLAVGAGEGSVQDGQTTAGDIDNLAAVSMVMATMVVTGANESSTATLEETADARRAGVTVTATVDITATTQQGLLLQTPARPPGPTAAETAAVPPTAIDTPNPTAAFTLEAASTLVSISLPTPAATALAQPTATDTLAPTAISTPEATSTPTLPPTATETPLPTATFTPEATNTPTPTASAISPPTATETPRPTATFTAEATSTPTPPPTATETPRPTATSTPTPPPTATETPRPTATFTPEATGMVSGTAGVAVAPISDILRSINMATAVMTPGGVQAPVLSATATITQTPLLQPANQAFQLYFPFIVHRPSLQAVVDRNANLRAGPDITFPIVGGARAGDAITLVACNADCTWYQLANGVWIAAFLVQIPSDPSQILPQATPIAAGE